MSSQPKLKFSKTNIKPSQAYRETKGKHKEFAPNPKIAKLDLIEKDEIEASLQVEWECKIENLREKRGANYSHIKHTTYDYYD